MNGAFGEGVTARAGRRPGLAPRAAAAILGTSAAVVAILRIDQASRRPPPQGLPNQTGRGLGPSRATYTDGF